MVTSQSWLASVTRQRTNMSGLAVVQRLLGRSVNSELVDNDGDGHNDEIQ